MAEVVVTVSGNLTGDPELRFIPSGSGVASFTVASTPRVLDAKSKEWSDGETTFLRVSVWRRLGEQCAEVLRKGDPVIVVGKLRQRSYEKDGQKRTLFEVEASDVGLGLGSKRLSGDAGKSAGSGSRSKPTAGAW